MTSNSSVLWIKRKIQANKYWCDIISAGSSRRTHYGHLSVPEPPAGPPPSAMAHFCYYRLKWAISWDMPLCEILVRCYLNKFLPTDSPRTIVRSGASDGPASLRNSRSLLLQIRMGHLVWDIGSVLSQLAPPDGHLSGPEPRAGPPHLRYSPQWHILVITDCHALALSYANLAAVRGRPARRTGHHIKRSV